MICFSDNRANFQSGIDSDFNAGLTGIDSAIALIPVKSNTGLVTGPAALQSRDCQQGGTSGSRDRNGREVRLSTEVERTDRQTDRQTQVK